MGSASQESTRFEYRNHVYKLSLTRGNSVYVEIFKMGSSQTLTYSTFGTGWRQRTAKKAVRKAHAWARDVIDSRLVVLNAIEEVDSSTCRGLNKS